ncbi:MAG: dTMP kinase [Gemmatimonadaceae bacterium]
MRGAGTLVVFEGPEGSGKTTQIARLTRRLDAVGVVYLAVREPGGTPLGDAIRALLLDPSGAVGRAAEALLFMASRAQLVEEKIRPALTEKKVVVLDRFLLSTYAYQIAGRGLGEEAVRSANALATGGIRPDVTILLSVPPAVGLARMRGRGDPDRMELAASDFHDRVAAGFRTYATEEWQRAHPECGQIAAVDGTKSEDEVERDVAAILAPVVGDGVRIEGAALAARGGERGRSSDDSEDTHA